MRRFLFLLVLLTFLADLTAVSPALPKPSPAAALPLRLQYLGSERPDVVFPLADDPEDQCYDAPELSLPGGGGRLIFDATEDASDPALTCAWGAPPPPRGNQGYRTIWYKFQPGRSGVVTIETLGSNYDTILGVYTGTCTQGDVNLTMLACNDDYQALTSRLTFTVRRGTTYYVEMADWQFSLTQNAQVELAAWLEPVDSAWKEEGTMPLPRSRHMMVNVGQDLYVIGGVEGFGFPLDLTNSVQRYNVAAGEWTTLSPLALPDGVANTEAVYLDGKIYIPGGFTGNVNAYNNTHWVYEPATDLWSTAAPPVWPGSANLAWATAVVPQTATIPPGYFLIGGTADVPSFDPPYTTSFAQPSGEVLYYFAESDQWNADFFPELQTPRFGHMAAWVGGRLCVVGGLAEVSSSNVILSGGECYQSGSWQSMSSGLNVSRYGAGSAVGPDGKWYVFGGTSSIQNDDDETIAIAVESTEVYDPQTGTWMLLGAAYDLGDFTTSPPRSWPRGVFIGDTLWAMGGNEINATSDLVPLMESLMIYSYSLWLPYSIRAGEAAPPPNNTFGAAYGLVLNQAQQHDFDEIRDIYDVYFFDVPDLRPITVKLQDIPDDSDYNLTLYDSNKMYQDDSSNPGAQDEIIQRTLGAGRYYIIIERVFPAGPPNTSDYLIVAEG